MTLYEELQQEIDLGLKGQNASIKIGLDRVDQFIELSKGNMITVIGETGSAKSSFVVSTFIYQPLVWYLANKHQTSIELDILSFSLERRQVLTTAKITSRIIFENTGKYISMKKILGRGDNLMTEEEQQYVAMTEDVWNQFEEHLYVRENIITYEELRAYIHDFASKHGKITDEIDKQGNKIKVYKLNNPNKLTILVLDHIGLSATDKEGIDKVSKLLRQARDFYHMLIVVVMQMNRNMSTSSTRIKDVKPKISDMSGTSSVGMDSDIILGILDIYRHVHVGETEENEVKDVCGYDLRELIDERGIKYYRSLHILKNTWEGEGVSFGLAFEPKINSFITMPKANEITEEDYNNIRTSKFFRPHQKKLF